MSVLDDTKVANHATGVDDRAFSYGDFVADTAICHADRLEAKAVALAIRGFGDPRRSDRCLRCLTDTACDQWNFD